MQLLADPVAGPQPQAPPDQTAVGVGHAPPVLVLAPTVLAWLCGVAWQLQQPALWKDTTVACAALLAIALAGLGWRLVAVAYKRPDASKRDEVNGKSEPSRSGERNADTGTRRARAGVLFLMLAAATLGAALTHQRAAWRLADALPAALEGQDLLVTGVIADLPQPSLQGTRFVFDVEAALHAGQPVRIPRSLALGWYRGAEADALLAGAAEDLRAGDRWQLTLRLKQPHGTMNPHGFDLELWLFERGIRASGGVRSAPDAVNLRLGQAVGQPVQRTRQAVRDAITRDVPDSAAAGVLAALVIGDQAAIDRADWDLFRTTGVAHLMSISGLHITMFAWVAAVVLGWLWRRSARALLAVPAPVAARWGGLVLAAAYAVLAGWGVPAQRTVCMLAVVALLRSLGLRWPLPGVLLAAAAAVALLDPWALLQPGFWLSFVAVGLLALSEPRRASTDTAVKQAGWRRWRAGAFAGLRTQMVATVGLAPLSLLFFQQVSVVGLLANLLAIPLVTLLVTPLGLLGVVLAPAWTLAAGLVQGLSAFLKVLADWPMAVWTAAAAPAWAVASGLLAALLAVLPLPWRLRLCSLPLLLPLLWPAVPRPAPGQFEMVAADVGQGTAVLVRTQGHLLVYDTGPAYTPEADAGSRVLLPLLRARGENHVDLLMLSHRDTDHVGGAASLLQGLPVRAISSSLAPNHPLLQRGVPSRRCAAGQSWTWDGVRFDVLHPAVQPENAQAGTGAEPRPNAQSCVLRVQGQIFSVLLTGDIEAPQELALVQRQAVALQGAAVQGDVVRALVATPHVTQAVALAPSAASAGDVAPAGLKSDVLLVPHHGSRTSSTAEFLAAVAPRVAVAQAAYRSRFGHPAPDVQARYESLGIEFRRTDRCGAYVLQADGSAQCTRQARARYWHHPLGLAAAPAMPS